MELQTKLLTEQLIGDDYTTKQILSTINIVVLNLLRFTHNGWQAQVYKCRNPFIYRDPRPSRLSFILPLEMM